MCRSIGSSEESEVLERRLVKRVIAALRTAWISEAALREVAQGLCQLVPDGQVILALPSRCSCPSVIVHDLEGTLTETVIESPEEDGGVGALLSLMEECSHRPDHVWSTRALSRRHRPAVERARRGLLESLGLWYVMSVSVTDGGRQLASVAFARPRSQGDYCRWERRRLEKVLPTLRDGLVVTETLEGAHLEAAQLERVVDHFHSPAHLVTAEGDVLFRNEAARSHTEPRQSPLAEDLQGCVTPVLIGQRQAYLVVSERAGRRPGGPRRRTRRSLEDLPPALARVADLLVEGLADKEIAQQLDLSLSTARTYVARVYRRLGVHGRGQLLSEILSERGPRLVA